MRGVDNPACLACACDGGQVVIDIAKSEIRLILIPNPDKPELKIEDLWYRFRLRLRLRPDRSLCLSDTPINQPTIHAIIKENNNG
jgi:hypothetical protein